MNRIKRYCLLGLFGILMIVVTIFNIIYHNNTCLVALFSAVLNVVTAAFFYLLGSVPFSERLENTYIYEFQNNILPRLNKRIRMLSHRFANHPAHYLTGQKNESKKEKIGEDIINNRQDIFMQLDNWSVSVYNSLSNGQINGKLIYAKTFLEIKDIVNEFQIPLSYSSKRVENYKKKLRKEGHYNKVIGTYYPFSNLKNLLTVLNKLLKSNR